MTRDNRQILVNPHSSVEKIPAGVLNLGEIAVQHNNVEDAALYVETVADSASAETVAKFITEKAIDSKIDDAMDVLQMEIDGINEAVGLPHETGHFSGDVVWDAIEQMYEEMTAGTAAASTKLELDDEPDTDKYMTLTAATSQETSSVTYTIGLKGIDDAMEALESGFTAQINEVVDMVEDITEEIDDKIEALSAGTLEEVNKLEDAIEELEEKVEANELESSDGSLIITPAAGTGKTDIVVNIDGKSIVLNDNNELVADLKLSSITPSAENVKEEYALINHEGVQLGDSVKIYKDSALYNVYLGHVDDALSDPTDPESVVAGSGDTALCFIYEKADGTYELVPINVENFLEESEFADGLQVNDHVVSVLVDPTSEEVEIESGVTAPVLSVSADGVKVDNIQAAINYAVSQAAGLIDADVTGSSEDGHVSVEVIQRDSEVKEVVVSTSDIASDADLAALSGAVEDLEDALAEEAEIRERADAELLGTSASTSAETSIWGIKNLISELTLTLVKDVTTASGETLLVVSKEDTPEGDLYTISSTERLNNAVELAEAAVVEADFAAVADKDETVYGSNAGIAVVPADGGSGSKISLDLSTLKVDCGEY